MIETSTLNEWQKLLISFAYYEQKPHEFRMDFLQQKLDRYSLKNLQLKIIKQCLTRIKYPSLVFDISFYYNLLMESKNLEIEDMDLKPTPKSQANLLKKEKKISRTKTLDTLYHEKIYQTQLILYNYLYQEHTKQKAIKLWDALEELRQKPITEENENRLKRLLIK